MLWEAEGLVAASYYKGYCKGYVRVTVRLTIRLTIRVAIMVNLHLKHPRNQATYTKVITVWLFLGLAPTCQQ